MARPGQGTAHFSWVKGAGHWALPLGAALAVALSSLAPWYWGCVLAIGVAAGGVKIVDRVRKDLDSIQARHADLDDQLVQSQKLAAVGELASGVAHEINTPLAVIGQEAEILQHHLRASGVLGGQDGPEIEDSLGQILIQVERCGEITHKLLAFARKTKAVIQETDVNSLVEDMVRLVEREASYDNIVVHRQFDPDLPTVKTDPALLRQVFLNLLNNAVQAVGRDGSVTVTSGRLDPERIEIRFRDTGCGIPKENLAQIFNPFFTTKPPGKGTGLGLSICQTILHKLGGSIAVESEPGKGALFMVRLPLRSNGGSITEGKTTDKENR